MTAIVSPIRFDRLQQSLGDVLAEATGVQTKWGYDRAVFDGAFGSELLNLTIPLGPVAENDRRHRGKHLIPPSQVDLSIDSVVIPHRYIAEINDHSFFYDSQVGDDAAAIRDALIATMSAETAWFTAAASGADVRLTPAFTGGIWYVAVGENVSGVAVEDTASTVRITKGSHVLTVSVGCFSKNTTPRAGAWDLSAKAQGAFESEDLLEVLRGADITVRGVGTGVDLSDVAGASWESRVSFDVDLAVPATFVRPSERVETITADFGTGAFSVSRL